MSTKCVKCKSDILLDDVMLLHWCEIKYVSESAVASSSEAEEQPLLCNNCTYICDRCKVGGCSECVKTECCDCAIMMCRKCSDVDECTCDCFGKCYTCGTDVSRGSGWPCNECGIWNCSDCKKCDNNSCKECGPAPKLEKEKEKVEEVKTTFNCESCKTEHPLETAIPCEWCDRELEKNCVYTFAPRKDDKEAPLFCKKCTLMCDACEIRGCKECVTFACCDCGYDMCMECRNNEVDCGCYGNCYSCGVDVNRGSEGWPCGECEKWYCRYCRQGDNPCKECGPELEPESEEEEDAGLETRKVLEEEK